MHDYSYFIFGFWWLIFPIMGFVFGGFGMWMSHRRSQRALDILKSYADQGKEPPPEIMQAIQGGHPGYGPGPYNGGGGVWGGAWGQGGWRAYRWGPYWAWRRFIIFASLTAGFGIAAWYEGDGPHSGFAIVAIIMGALAIGSFFFAILNSVFGRGDPAQRP